VAKQSAGEILHFSMVRMRVIGSGNLRLTIMPLDGIASEILSPLALSSATSAEKDVLTSVRSQYAQIEVKTTHLNDKFTISRLRILVKPSMASYPV
jgi:hypothetical protein